MSEIQLAAFPHKLHMSMSAFSFISPARAGHMRRRKYRIAIIITRCKDAAEAGLRAKALPALFWPSHHAISSFGAPFWTHVVGRCRFLVE